MPKATPGYLREIAALTSANREMYRKACKDAADEIERLEALLVVASGNRLTDEQIKALAR